MLKKLFEEKLKKIKPKKEEDDMPSIMNPRYPTLYLCSESLPEIKDWEVGDKYYLVLKVEQKGKNMHTQDKKEKWNADFDILEIGVLDNEESKEEKLKDKYKV